MMKNSSHTRFMICFIAVSLFYFGSCSRSQAQEVNYKSYSIYVYNFIKYIEWPENSTTGDFVIMIVGDSPVSKELATLAANKKIKGQNIVIKKCNSLDDIGQCQLLYISSSKSNLLKAAIAKTKNMPTLLIAEREGLAKKGAGINFLTLEDETLKFEMNKKAIESHNLKIPKVLYGLGILVG